MDELKEAYAKLGELQIRSEILAGQMNECRQIIARLLNKQMIPPQTPPKLEEAK